MNYNNLSKLIEKKLDLPTVSDIIQAFEIMLASVWDFIGDFENNKFYEGRFPFRSSGNVSVVVKNFQERLIHCISNEEYLFESDHIQTELIDLSIDREDAIKALLTLKSMYNNCKIKEEKDILENVFESSKRSTNLLIRSIKKMCKDRGKENLLKNKDLDEINISLKER